MIPDEDIERVRERTDVVALFSEYAPVKRQGSGYWCCCPFHKEKTPSCKIEPDTGYWHCFGCGEGGSVFNFVMKKQNVTFPEAVQILADKGGVEIHNTAGKSSGMSTSKRSKYFECMNMACEFFAKYLLTSKTPDADEARKYLASRNFGIDVAKRWKLGFAPTGTSVCGYLISKGVSAEDILACNLGVVRNGQVRDRFFGRVMFPIFDSNNNCVAFGGRVIGEGNPKYLNSSETPIFHKSRVLFGMNVAQSEIVATGSAIVVEGYTDVIAMHEAGFKNVVATLGTSLTIQHIKLLSRYANKNIIYLFDGDEAGQRAAERALKFIDYTIMPESGTVRCSLCAATIPDKMDPMEYITAKGAPAMAEILDHPTELIAFGIDRIIGNASLDTKEDRMRTARVAVSILAPIKNTDIAKDYARRIAHKTLLDEFECLNMLSKLKEVKNSYDDEFDISNTDDALQENLNSVGGEDKKSPDSNRDILEKTALSLCSQFSETALSIADDILGIKWHDQVNLAICDKIFEILGQDLSATRDKIFDGCCQVSADASNVLTYALEDDASIAGEKLQTTIFLLQIEDVRDEITTLSLKLNDKSLEATKVTELMTTLQEKQRMLIDLENKTRKMME